MSKEPWEEQVFPKDEQGESRKERKNAGVQTPILTILLSIFFVIFVGVLLFAFYTSNGNTSREEATTGFYGASTQVDTKNKKSESDSSETQSVSQLEEPTETTSVSQTEAVIRNGGTTVVEAGEGAGAIAARVGISLDKLYALNPEKMTGPGGTWWANPGDVVYID
ncbi:MULTISPECIES: SAG1386/EF1546 family surface-associated protein [Streptococcus]|uniref:SAG1386/EF1546 family surface-associated protein n=1 Tax=Streptococcus caledonicus TaxID=2614158 RepID=A0ABW0UDQ3_9STRE|nr:SAG1386/EF1546 family surface-associated protein [Streptococcus sp. S784/96/1]